MKKQPDECANCTYLQDRESIMNLTNDVKLIKDALLGTEYTEGKGLVHQVQEHEKFIIDKKNDIDKIPDHEKYITKSKMKGAKLSGIVLAASFILSLIVTKWTWLYDKIFGS